MEYAKLKNIIEAALLAAAKPLTVNQLEKLFEDSEAEPVEKDKLREALKELQQEYENKGVELKHVASGYRMQVRQELEPWIARLWEEKPPRYSRALLETLSIIAYRQPITRGEIEDIRGVVVSSNITRTLQEREWIRVVGHRDVPGKPAMFGTTKEFLDYFNLKHLDELPALAELRDLDSIHPELDLEGANEGESTEAAEAEAELEASNVVELEAAAEQPEKLH
jgi:segregation and condensation protein B